MRKMVRRLGSLAEVVEGSEVKCYSSNVCHNIHTHTHVKEGNQQSVILLGAEKYCAKNLTVFHEFKKFNHRRKIAPIFQFTAS